MSKSYDSEQNKVNFFQVKEFSVFFSFPFPYTYSSAIYDVLFNYPKETTLKTRVLKTQLLRNLEAKNMYRENYPRLPILHSKH